MINDSMKKLYLIRRQDVFEAIAAGQLPENCLMEAGSLWAIVRFTPEEKEKYSFPIWENF